MRSATHAVFARPVIAHQMSVLSGIEACVKDIYDVFEELPRFDYRQIETQILQNFVPGVYPSLNKLSMYWDCYGFRKNELLTRPRPRRVP